MELEKKELEQFQTYLRKKGVADNTIIAYRTAVRQFYQQASGISVGEFQAYKQYLIHHYHPSTVNTRIYGINQYILFLQRREEKIFGRKQTNQKDEQEGQKKLITLDHYQVPAVRRQQKPFLDNIISAGSTVS